MGDCRVTSTPASPALAPGIGDRAGRGRSGGQGDLQPTRRLEEPLSTVHGQGPAHRGLALWPGENRKKGHKWLEKGLQSAREGSAERHGTACSGWHCWLARSGTEWSGKASQRRQHVQGAQSRAKKVQRPQGSEAGRGKRARTALTDLHVLLLYDPSPPFLGLMERGVMGL